MTRVLSRREASVEEEVRIGVQKRRPGVANSKILATVWPVLISPTMDPEYACLRMSLRIWYEVLC